MLDAERKEESSATVACSLFSCLRADVQAFSLCSWMRAEVQGLGVEGRGFSVWCSVFSVGKGEE